MTHTKITIIRNDPNHGEKTNYYNYPTTISLGKTKFVLGAGNSDTIDVRKRKDAVYVVSQNKGLEYISLTVIDKYHAVSNVYLSSNDLNDKDVLSYGLLDKTTFQQIKVLCEYL